MASVAPQIPSAPHVTDRIRVLITGSDIGPETLAGEARASSPRLDVAVLPDRDALPASPRKPRSSPAASPPPSSPAPPASSGCTRGPRAWT